jgi:hypothetical protein
MDRLQSALNLANLFAIFPIQPGQKVPLAGSKGFKDATLDLEQIKAWWADEPNLNIGVSPGEHYVVFDFEGEGKGNDLAKSLKLFTRKTGMTIDLTDNFVVDTPSGGVHVYYKTDPFDERVYTSTVNFVKGCDIRAAGGYVLGPGSTVDGLPYKSRCSKLPRTMPEGLGQLLPTKRERVENNTADERELDLVNNCKRAIQFLKDSEPAIEGQGGDSWTFATAAKVRNFGISEERCLEFMLAHFNPRCEPPWEPDELGVKVANAYEFAMEKQGVDGGDPNLAFGDMIAEQETLVETAVEQFQFLGKAEVENWPAPVWSIKKLLPARGLGFIIGPWGSYKTYVAIDLAASIATGRDFASREFKRGGTVIYLAGEGPYGVKMRFQAWFTHMGMGWSENLFLVDKLPNFGDPEQVKAFIAQAKALGPVLIIVDTISMASLGADENSAKDMGLVLQGMKAMRDQLDAFVLGVHHMGKDKSKGSRGWSGLPAAADVEIQVTADSDKKEAYVLLNKSRDSERWSKKEVFAASKIELGKDDDGDKLFNLAFRHNPAAKAPAGDDERDNAFWRDIKDLLREPEMAGKPQGQKAMSENLAEGWHPEVDFKDDAAKAGALKNARKILERLAKTEMGILWTMPREKGGVIEWIRPAVDKENEDIIEW